MTTAYLHAIYSLLLAHCFTLHPQDEKLWRAAFGNPFGVERVPCLWQPPRKMRCAIPEHYGAELHGVDGPVSRARKPENVKTFHINCRERIQLCRCDQAIAPAPVKVCSMPSRILQLIAADLLSRYFDLNGVPGFYRADPKAPLPGADETFYWLEQLHGPWRINLPMRTGLLVPYDNGGGYIIGIRIFKSTRDRRPVVLTSRELPGGASAIAYREAVAA